MHIHTHIPVLKRGMHIHIHIPVLKRGMHIHTHIPVLKRGMHIHIHIPVLKRGMHISKRIIPRLNISVRSSKRRANAARTFATFWLVPGVFGSTVLKFEHSGALYSNVPTAPVVSDNSGAVSECATSSVAPVRSKGSKGAPMLVDSS